VARSEKSLSHQIGAHRLHATHDSRELTTKGRAAFLSRFDSEVDPEGVLNPAERSRRAEHAKKAYFLTLAAKSAKARATRKNETKRA
jgi:hypothetical protein